MGELTIPTDLKFNAPWFLDDKPLNELANTFEIIEKKIEEAYNIQLEKNIQKEVENYKNRDKDIKVEELGKKLKLVIVSKNKKSLLYLNQTMAKNFKTTLYLNF